MRKSLPSRIVTIKALALRLNFWSCPTVCTPADDPALRFDQRSGHGILFQAMYHHILSWSGTAEKAGELISVCNNPKKNLSKYLNTEPKLIKSYRVNF